MAAPITWLHISDIHMGCRGDVERNHLHEVFFQDIETRLKGFGAPDLVFITGDIGWHSKPEEYAQFNQFLAALQKRLPVQEGRPAPIIIPVPGNHDLVRPSPEEIEDSFSIVRKIANHNSVGVSSFVKLGDNLYKTTYKAMFEDLFINYQTWFKDLVNKHWNSPFVKYRLSPFPGDFSIHLDFPEQPPLSVMGLNSAWMQITGDDYEGKMEIFTQQYQLAAGEEHYFSPNNGRHSFLLMHHPPGWLSQGQGKNTFDEFIYPQGRFWLCMYGHMHQARAGVSGTTDSSLRYFYQAPSLFGLQGYGTKEKDRSFGYTWGKMTANGQVKLWPLVYHVGDARVGKFIFDPNSQGDLNTGNLLRRGISSLATRKTVRPAAPFSLTSWLHSLLDRTDHIKIGGIGTGRGLGREAKPTYPIEDLYTTLKSRDDGQDGSRSHETVLLQQLLPRHPRLLIEGAPGSGKSTFLNLVATMLARDLLNQPCTKGSSWRHHHLGFATHEPAKIPLLLKLAGLEKVLADKKADDRHRLLDLLAATPNASTDPAWRRYWEKRLDGGEVMLLLDGLDEVANLETRGRVFLIFKDALRHWGQCPMVVTSRPFETEQLKQLKFKTTTIAPFEAGEIREFLDRWVAALHGLALGQSPDAKVVAQVETLNKAIVERLEIRRMATNPVMLTCLCVVHWNEGQLPDGRARVYQAVINWLIKSREEQRKEAGFTNELAERAFPRLALTMMGDNGVKRPILGLEQAAEAVAALVARQCSLTDPEDIRLKAKQWLAFECLWSGILEETGLNNVKFWHLTFQEYLAARQLVWLGGDEATGWWPLLRPHLTDPQWRETVEMVPGCLIDGGDASVDLLLQRVLAGAGPIPDLAKEARVAGIMGRLLAPMTAYGYKPHADINTPWQHLLTRTMAIFTAEGAAKVPVKDRIAAAEALGEGDPRLRELTLLPVKGTDWQLGKYLVTVLEYQRFVEHNGYQKQRWWDETGWKLQSEKGWESPNDWDNQLLHPNWPVTGVSWFEAMAYCRWLSEQKKRTIRLPDDVLWEKATKGEYPWGEAEPTPELANFAPDWNPNVGSPTPVGVYPAGDGPFGHSDLAGNVLEWQRNLYENESAIEVPKGVFITEGYIELTVRGGSWLNAAAPLRSAFRLRNHADGRLDNVGFRLAAAPASI